VARRTAAYNAWIWLLILMLVGSCSAPVLVSIADPQGACDVMGPLMECEDGSSPRCSTMGSRTSRGRGGVEVHAECGPHGIARSVTPIRLAILGTSAAGVVATFVGMYLVLRWMIRTGRA
jgi:hypothetical protein